MPVETPITYPGACPDAPHYTDLLLRTIAPAANSTQNAMHLWHPRQPAAQLIHMAATTRRCVWSLLVEGAVGATPRQCTVRPPSAIHVVYGGARLGLMARFDIGMVG